MELVASAHSLGTVGTATPVHALPHPPRLPCICAVPGTVLTCHTHVISFNPQRDPWRREFKGVKQLIRITQLMKGGRVSTSSPPPPGGRVPRFLDTESELGGQFGSWLTPCIFKHH